MVPSGKALFNLDIFSKPSVICQPVSSAAKGLGSKMFSLCSVNREEHNLAKVGVEGSNPFARSKT
jgi:hypothetical protein